MGIIVGPTRYALVPWSDIRPSDLMEQGDPELVRDCRHERHLGLHVRGEYVASLGLLAIRCERHHGWLLPLSMAIADTPPFVNTDQDADAIPVQSNPRRRYGDWDWDGQDR